MFQIKKDVDQTLITFIKSQKSELKAHEIAVTDHLSNVLHQMVLVLLENDNAVLTTDNQIKIYTDGNVKFTDLISAIKGARDHIHLEYYIWRDDRLSHEMRDALTERARAGVEVKFYAMGLAVPVCLGIFSTNSRKVEEELLSSSLLLYVS